MGEDALMRLDGQAALVTGAGRGVGKGIALELARAGCRVAINYHASAEEAEETVAEIKGFGGDAFMVAANVAVAAEVRAMVGAVATRFRRLDVLVNNAGVQTWTPFLDVTEHEWDHVIDTNLKGCFLCSQAAALYMKEHGGGAIVNIGSGCNKAPFPNLVAYTASKGGIEMLTRVAAVELGPYRIRVNCVAPGAIEIERTRLENPEYARVWGEITPLGRVGTPADVGRAVVYLASPAASFVSGQTLWVDGALFTQARWAYQEARTEPVAVEVLAEGASR
jgi:NAD(P)-dependent dehydrogenase (short-subunit alcohol dehydrogenase family)